jgi:hypothetical protein
VYIPPCRFDNEKDAQDNKDHPCAKIEQTAQKLHDKKTDGREGQRVSFDVTQGPKGPAAENVKAL